MGTSPKISKALLDFVRPSPHSLFSPSAAERWLACPFSVDFTKDIPNESSKYSEEGTLAHSVCEAAVRKRLFDVNFPADLLLQMSMLPDRGEEMVSCAEAYADCIEFWLNNSYVMGDVIYFAIEKGVPVFPEESCFGTADCLIIGTKGAAIIDFKYGRGKNVAPNSLQLKVYAAGIYKNLTDIPKDYKFYSVVHQPRTDMHPKEHCYELAELQQFLADIHWAIQKSKETNLTPCEGNHCFWCPAKRTKDRAMMCPVVLEKPIKLANENFAKFLEDMHAPVERLGDVNVKRDEAIIKLRALYPLIKSVVEASEEEFQMRLGMGEVIPGVRLVDVIGKRELSGITEIEKARMIEEKFKINPWKIIPETKKLRTITEIEKEIGKGKLDSICVKKITKKVDILDEKIRGVLGEMSAFSAMINNNEGQGQE